MNEEIWKSIKNYENLYEVSNLGKIRSLDRIVKNISKKGNPRPCLTKGRILSMNKNNGNGYLICALHKDSVKKNYYFHRLVAEAFIPNPNNKAEVNHKDGNKKNNNVDNLEWVTLLENRIHCKNNNLIKYGENSHFSKLKEFEVLQIRKLLKINSEESELMEIAKKYNISITTVKDIRNRKSWKRL